MIQKRMQGFIILQNKDDRYNPPTSISHNWKHWKTTWDLKTCERCKSMHGKLWANYELPDPEPPLHPNCRCTITPTEAVAVGTATKDAQMGADWSLRYHGELPKNYISSHDLRASGWKWGDSPAKFAPGKMATMGIYRNDNRHLPDTLGRIWYEADINYYIGKRNSHRILWSNDGLMFVTYDHYRTFIEVT